MAGKLIRGGGESSPFALFAGSGFLLCIVIILAVLGIMNII